MLDFTAKEVNSQWKQDSQIDKSNLDIEICKTPSLHSKYVDFYIDAKNHFNELDDNYRKLGNVKRKYYKGEFTEAELKHWGWSQYQGIKPSNTELNSLLEYDKEMIKLKSEINVVKTIIEVCEMILKNITYRDTSIKTIYEYNRYINGG